jgi:hypothetical protein
MSIDDDLADRINDIIVKDSADENKIVKMEIAKTSHFRKRIFNSIYPIEKWFTFHPPDYLPQDRPQASFWKSIWNTDMPHNARNIWWRLLIGKLPAGSRLHAFLPDIPIFCRVCENETETDQHLLFSCPKKLDVWQSALSKYVKDQEWTIHMIENWFYPSPNIITPLNDVPMFLLLGTILATIWKYHFQSIRDDELFDSGRVSAAVDIEMISILAQLAEKKRRTPSQAPPQEEPPRPDTNFPT